jgi:hypothetical protein
MNLHGHHGGSFISSSPDGDDEITAPAFFYLVLQAIFNLNTRILHRKFHIMMLEEQLRHRMFLNKAGAYSIRKGDRSVLESLQYTSALLGKKENLVVLYPQGEFESVYQQPVKFENGLKNIAAGVQNNFQLLFYVALVDYFSHRKPFLTTYLLEVPQEIALIQGGPESAYNAFLAECIMQQKPE